MTTKDKAQSSGAAGEQGSKGAGEQGSIVGGEQRSRAAREPWGGSVR